jgi:hypothetical protein
MGVQFASLACRPRCPHAVPDDWVALEIDLKLNPESGPVWCFSLLANREFYAKDTTR